MSPVERQMQLREATADSHGPIRAVRHVETVRRGRSRPIVIEADDGHQYVMKLVASPESARRAIAEVIGSRIGRSLGLPQAPWALLEIGQDFDTAGLPASKLDEVASSLATAFGSRVVPDAVSFRIQTMPPIDPDLAAAMVWFDSLITNNDRRNVNPNLLLQGDQIVVIDNDSALQIQERWADPKRRHRYNICAGTGMAWWKLYDHCLLPFANSIVAVGPALAPRLTPDRIAAIVAIVPEAWLAAGFPAGGLEEVREKYVEFLSRRVQLREDFERHADDLRSRGITPMT